MGRSYVNTSSVTQNTDIYQTTSTSTNINPTLQDNKNPIVATSGSSIATDTSSSLVNGSNSGTITITDGQSVSKALELTAKVLDTARSSNDKVQDLVTKIAVPNQATQEQFTKIFIMAAAAIALVMVWRGFK